MSKEYNDGQKVETMVALGLTHEQIGYVLGCTAKTLRKYYAKELANGKAKVDALIGGQLVKKALGGNMTAIIFYLKTKCGWREVQQVETTITNFEKLDFSFAKPSDNG